MSNYSSIAVTVTKHCEILIQFIEYVSVNIKTTKNSHFLKKIGVSFLKGEFQFSNHSKGQLKLMFCNLKNKFKF